MAVTGFHNVSAFGSSFCDSAGRPGTRASSLLQMWRDLEGEVVNQSPRKQQNGSDSECASTCTSVGQGSENGDDVSQDSDESANQGRPGLEAEQEDNNSVISEQSSDFGEIERERVRQIFREWKNSCPKGHLSRKNRVGQWLGENERERVRIIREWVQISTQQRDGVAEIGSQIEQVRDGLAMARPEVGARRPIRRLCGRQTLLDLLLRAQSERKRELMVLSEQRPVSEFAHRNRIQALLRGRFLRNERPVLDERPSSIAAIELGLLRQRHTVSDLREGFLSRLDSSTSTIVNNAESDSSLSDEDTCGNQELTRVLTASELGPEELIEQVIEGEDIIFNSQGIEHEVSPYSGSASTREDLNLENEAMQLDVSAECMNATMTDGPLLQSVDSNYNGPVEVYHEIYESRSGAAYDREVDGHTADLEGNTNEFRLEDASAQADEFQESAVSNEERGWQQLSAVAYTEWADGSIEEDTSDNSVEVQELQEEWPAHELQEAIDSWLDMPSEDVGPSVTGIDTFYYPDDDDDANVHNMELRELFSRRRVSSLLRSSFRESLNQVLQSHAERLGHASGDWEDEEDEDEDEDQLNGGQTMAMPDGAERTRFAPSSPTLFEELQDANWPHHNSDQHLGTDLEIIGELRIDMARLHHKMNNMQSMLEACMDMQVELQRQVRQEVSAALNRSTSSRDESQGSRVADESQWDQVRKGICCICRDDKIDSLLYRCGHMCTCSKCAEKLVQCTGKCPMCRAPVVEAVRAYFIQ